MKQNVDCLIPEDPILTDSSHATVIPEPNILRNDNSGITTLTLNRPKQYNALSEELLIEMQGIFDNLGKDDTVRVIVLTGAGRAFCTGHDLKQMRANPNKDYYKYLFSLSSKMMLSMLQLPQPVIARVHGTATAAGCQLVASCDLAVASTEAHFAVSGINVGLFCSTPGVPLSRNMSRKRAMEMLLTGKFIDAETAEDYGLINHAVAPELLDSTILELAQSIAEKTPVAIKLGKELFYKQLEKPISEAYAVGGETMAGNMMTEDAAEGIDAFIEKRKPVWKGR